MKRKQRQKLHLSRETLRHLVHGTSLQWVGKDTVEPQCYSKSLDPPTCCDTCPTVACDCNSDPCTVIARPVF